MTQAPHIPEPPELFHAAEHSDCEIDLESALSGQLDDRTLAYVLAVRPCFDALRQVAAQLAGLLVLASSGGRTTVLQIPVLDLAVDAFGEAEDTIHVVPVPPRALHYHFHLARAADRIGGALAIARSGSLRRDDDAIEGMLKLLRAGWNELHRAAQALPGFQVVDFNQACCALHGPARLEVPDRRLSQPR